jgi:hypothetical protein
MQHKINWFKIEMKYQDALQTLLEHVSVTNFVIRDLALAMIFIVTD